jgi:hypothetical protein
VASRSVHFARALGSFCCPVSVWCFIKQMSRKWFTGYTGNIKQSNPPPEK